MSGVTLSEQEPNSWKDAYFATKIELAQALQRIQELELILEAERQASKLKIASLEEKITILQEEVLLMLQRLFGKKSEAHLSEDLAADGTETNANGESDSTIAVSAHARRKKVKSRGRNIDTSFLPRYKVYHDLDVGEQVCRHCHNILEKMGQDTSEQIEILPKILCVVEHIRYKYTCRTCCSIVTSPKPPAPLPKALAGGSLLADVIVNKYQYHLPLYRQSKIFASFNADIPDNTLGNWVMESGSELMPLLLPPMWQATLSTNYLQVDETPVKVQKPNKKGYLWTYFAPYVGKGLVMFEFNLTRSGSVAEQRLANFKGLLQTDGYPGYTNLRKRYDITGLGCLTHARRKFSEIFKTTKNSAGITAEFINGVRPLYALEELMRESKFSFHTRKRLRQKQAWPILKVLLPWLKQQLKKVPPKSKLAEAIVYTLNQWRYIIAYLRHGMAEIDTNWVENEIRPIALGKKNWLFMNNEDSGAVNAFWYSLVASAMMNGLNPRVYIHYLLMNLHNMRRQYVDPMTLLPHTIDPLKLRLFEAEQLAFAKQILDSS